MEQNTGTYIASMIDALYPHGQPVINTNLAPLQSGQYEHTSEGSQTERTFEENQSDEHVQSQPNDSNQSGQTTNKPRRPKKLPRPNPELWHDGRIKCWVYRKLLQPSFECAQKITDILIERMEPAIYWSQVSTLTKEFYWGEFKKYFGYDTANEAAIKFAWKKKANACYRELMNNTRNSRVKKKVVEDDTRKALEAKWGTDDYKARRRINSKNRNSKNGPPLHGSGSVSFTEHAQRLAKILKRPPYPHELFLATHMSAKDRDKFIDERARLFYEKYRTIRAEKLAEMGGVVEEKDMMRFETEVYMEAVGGDKGYIYGLGCEAVNYAKEMRQAIADDTRSSATQSEMEELKSEVHQKYNDLEARMQGEVQRQVREQLQQQQCQLTHPQQVSQELQQQLLQQLQHQLMHQLQLQLPQLLQQQLPQYLFLQQQHSQHLPHQLPQQQQIPYQHVPPQLPQQQIASQLPQYPPPQPHAQQVQYGPLSSMIMQQHKWVPQGLTTTSPTPNMTPSQNTSVGNSSGENSSEV